jgi:hypothetical protein
MNDRADRELDEVLGRHLSACLDGQLGRAALAFRAELAPQRRTWRLWLSAGAAVAAGIAVTWMVFGHHLLHKSVPQRNEFVENSVEPPMLRTATWSGMMDDGTEVVDNQPMRRIKRKVVEQVEWYDSADRAMVRTTLPKQEIYLIGLETN